MNKISNKESHKHEHIRYPLIDRSAIVRHRGRCRRLTVSELHESGEEVGYKEQGNADSHWTHLEIELQIL